MKVRLGRMQTGLKVKSDGRRGKRKKVKKGDPQCYLTSTGIGVIERDLCRTPRVNTE